jgi:5,10-methylenetetrahydromethanopterin reductase
MPIRFGIRLPPCEPPQVVARAARAAEAAGFDDIWTLDSPLLAGRLGDPYVTLAACAMDTSRVRLGVAVTNPVTRHVAVTAAAVLSLDDLAGGRAVLGIGSGDSAMRTLGLEPADAEGTHASRRPRLRQAVATLRAILAGQPVGLGSQDVRLAGAPRRIPIYIAATGPRMLELAGEIADGVILQVGIHPAALTEALACVRAGAARAGRDPATVDLVCSTFTAIDDDRRRAIDRARPLAAWFYAVAPRLVEAAGLPVARRHPARPVYPDISHPADHALAMEEARSYVADEAVERLCLVGSAGECVRRIRELERLGIRQVFLRHYLTYALPWELIDLAGRAIIPCLRDRAVEPA